MSDALAGALKEIKRHRKKMNSELAQLLETARYGRADKHSEWVAALQRHDVEARSEEQLGATAQPLPNGAVRPIEFRDFLNSYSRYHCDQHQQYRSQFARLLDDPQIAQQLNEHRDFLHALAETYTAKYAESLRPTVMAAGIFGNALSSTKGFTQVNAGAATKKCATCGAPRPVDTNLSQCDYCGGNFF